MTKLLALPSLSSSLCESDKMVCPDGLSANVGIVEMLIVRAIEIKAHDFLKLSSAMLQLSDCDVE